MLTLTLTPTPSFFIIIIIIIFHTRVASLQRPERSNSEYRQYFGAVMPFFQGFEPTIHDMVEDERGNKVTIWCSSVSETAVGRYANEYMILLYFNGAGDKVERVVEFVDSAYSRSFFARLERFVAEGGQGRQQQQQASGGEPGQASKLS